jgi:hypothetical protein
MAEGLALNSKLTSAFFCQVLTGSEIDVHRTFRQARNRWWDFSCPGEHPSAERPLPAAAYRFQSSQLVRPDFGQSGGSAPALVDLTQLRCCDDQGVVSSGMKGG